MAFRVRFPPPPPKFQLIINSLWDLIKNPISFLSYYGDLSGSGACFHEEETLGWIWIESSLFPQFYRSADSSWYSLVEASGVSQLYKFDSNSQSWAAVNYFVQNFVPPSMGGI